MLLKLRRGSLNLIGAGGKGYFGGFNFIFIRRLPAVNVIGRNCNFTFANVGICAAGVNRFTFTFASINAYAAGVIRFAYIVYFNAVIIFNLFLFSFIAYGNR